MPKFFFALEKKTLQAYRDSRNEISEAAAKMSSAEIAEWKAELITSANIRALPEEVESSNFQAPAFYTIDEEGAANIEVSGVFLNYVDWFDLYYDDPITTYGWLREAALRADEDPGVLKIRFNVSTPGGIVDGVDFTSQVIANLKKPTETIGFGQISSAGIYLFSQTDKIISSDPTVFFGSIGVAVTYISRAKMYEEIGIEIIDFTNDDSKAKRPDLSTNEGQQIIIKELNDLFNIFIQRVATGRNVTVEYAKENFGKGAVLIAGDAEKVGLIDQVELKTNGNTTSTKRSSAESKTSHEGKTMDEKTMTLDEFLAQNYGAKADYEKRLTEAEEKAEEKGADKVKAFISRIHPLISAEGASKALIESGFKALADCNETAVAVFVGVADHETRMKEEAASKAAVGEMAKIKETPASQSEKSGDGVIRNQEDFDAEKQLFAKMSGKEVQ
jgi:ClpP class serine protease